MSNLLQVIRFQTEAMKKKGTMPLMMEFQISDETAPYLVTSSNAVLWVEKPHPGGLIKAAVRVATPGDIFQEMVKAVADRGERDEWGNVHPFTLKGLDAAMDHLRYYDLHEMEVLAAPSEKKIDRPEWLRTLPVRPASWVPKRWVIIVPKDRDYVGIFGHLSGKHVVGVTHNASRCIAILRGRR